MERRVVVFIPTFNDFQKLNDIVSEINRYYSSYEVVIIDDGSNPAGQFPAGCNTARLPVNLGLGVLTNIAMAYSIFNHIDIMVRLDSDGQHSVSDIAMLISQIESGSDIVIGSRMNRDNGFGITSGLSRIARGYISLIARFVLHSSLPRDMNSGFIAMNRFAMEHINTIDLDRFPEPQLMIIGAVKGCKIDEVSVIQNSRTEGKSSIGVLQALKLLYRVTVYALLVVTGVYR